MCGRGSRTWKSATQRLRKVGSRSLSPSAISLYTDDSVMGTQLRIRMVALSSTPLSPPALHHKQRWQPSSLKMQKQRQKTGYDSIKSFSSLGGTGSVYRVPEVRQEDDSDACGHDSCSQVLLRTVLDLPHNRQHITVVYERQTTWKIHSNPGQSSDK